MNFKKTMFALAIGSVGIMGAMSAHAVVIANGSTLTINNFALQSDGYVAATGGSWFGMEGNKKAGIQATERVGLEQLSATSGIVIGAVTTAAAGSYHPGAPTGLESNTIMKSWEFFTNTGTNFNSIAITGQTGNGTTAGAGLDFSGWRVAWNTAASNNINMGGGAWNGNLNGLASFSWNGVYGSAYTLDYSATVPLGDASGFGGVPYLLHLEGVVLAPVPEASTYGMMLAGLGLVGAMVARRRKSV